MKQRRKKILIILSVLFLLSFMQSFASDGDKTIRIHYHRFDETYKGWNLWVWPNGKKGKSYDFTDKDDFGKFGTFKIEESHDVEKIGFLLRKSTQDNEWAKKEIGDRYFLNDPNLTDIYLVQGDDTIYTDKNKVDLSPKLQAAFLDDLNKITIKSNLDFDLSKKSIEVIDSKGKKIKAKSITLNDNLATVTLEKSLDLTKNYTIDIENYNTRDIVFRNVFDTKAFNDAYYYDGNDLGANYTKNSTTFKVWAPTADKVDLLLEDKEKIKMEKADRGIYQITVDGDLHNHLYNYQIHFGDKVTQAVDPYAKGVTTNGVKGAVIDFDRLNPTDWDTDYKTNFSKDLDAIMYELHIRDLSISPSSGIESKGKFLGLSELNTKSPNGNLTGLSYIKSLGVTHIQLLPVFDFESIDEASSKPQYNWGYDPKNYNAIEGIYSTNPKNPSVRIKEFKEMIQTIHNQDLKVTMDVVYNHVFNVSTISFEKIVPGYFFRKDSEGNFANGSACGNETASDRKMMRKFMVDSTEFLAKEYNLDGFRFDLMGLHDIETMNAIRKNLDEIDPSITLIGEGWNMGNVLLPSMKANQKNAEALPNIGHFNDTLRDGLKGSVFKEKESGFINGNFAKKIDVKKGIVGGIKYDGLIYNWGDIEPNQSVSYVEAHDNHTLYDKLILTNPEASESKIKQMHLLADSIVLTSQGIPFIHAGQEFMRTKDGDENSYKSPDSINQLDWNRRDDYLDVVEYIKGLIELRKKHPAFRMPNSDMIRKNLEFYKTNNKVIAYELKDYANGDNWEKIVVIHNASKEKQEIKLSEKAKWKSVVNGKKSGVEPINTFESDRVNVSGKSTLILYKSSNIVKVKDPEKTNSNNKSSHPLSKSIIAVIVILIGIIGIILYFRK